MFWLFLFACTRPPTPVATPPLAAPPWSTPEGFGGYDVGVRTEVLSAERGELTVEIWYPAMPSDEPPRYGLPFEPPSIASRDAPTRGAAHPLILFSHGHGGMRQQSVFLTERLASHGFVVVAVDHPFDTTFDLQLSEIASVAGRRPDDVRQSLDWVEASITSPGHWLEGFTQADGVGMLGHSFGSWTALVLGGGVIDLQAGQEWCDSDRPAGCSIVGEIDETAGDLVPDPRITVTMMMAPGGWYSFSDLSAITPALVISGSADSDLPMDEEQQPTFERLGSPSTQLVLQQAGHFGFTDACAILPILDCVGEPDGYMEPLRVQDLSATAVVAFSGAHLLAEPLYADWLQPDAWPVDAVMTLR